MLEYLLILLLAIPVMAAHKRRKNFAVLRVDAEIALGTLGDRVVIPQSLTSLGAVRYYAVSCDLQYTINDFTAGEGPIEVGVANAVYSVTQIAESLTSSPSSQSDLISIERSRRQVRTMGKFAGLSTNEEMNDGKPIRQKMGWYLDDGIELNTWARNLGGAALTTGAIVNVTGQIYGYWK